MSGRIVILNGAPRAGKSSLARAIQDNVPGTWINWGVDAFNGTLPPQLLPGIGLRPGGERPDLEPEVARLFETYFTLLADLSRAGFDVVADLGMHTDYAAPFDPMTILHRRLSGLPVLLVGIDCALETIVERRRADTDARHVAGPDIPAPVRRWQDAVHAGKTYDLRLDMGSLSPAEGAESIARIIAKSFEDGRLIAR